MDEQTIGLALIVLGLLMVAVEALFPGGYIVIPGTIVLIVGVWGYFHPDELLEPVTLAIAVGVAVPVTAGTLYLYRVLARPAPPTTTVAESLIGKEGVVTVRVVPGNMKGKVKIGPDTWSAEADSEIPEGTPVVVVHAEGVHVKVGPRTRLFQRPVRAPTWPRTGRALYGTPHAASREGEADPCLSPRA